MNSDQDNVPAILNQLIPAGHATCKTSTVFECSSCLTCDRTVNSSLIHETSPNTAPQWTWQYPRDAENEILSQPQCDQSFPGLFQDIDRAVTFWKAEGGITPQHLDDMRMKNGMARVKIQNKQLYIISAYGKGEDHRRKILAVLSSMYRALVSAPDRNAVPDIEFIFSVEDLISDVVGNTAPVWSLARKVGEEAAWLFPDFGLWAWDQANNPIGPYSEIVEAVENLESEEVDFREKEMKLVWRGKLSFAPKLRRALLEVARGTSWGNVKELVWIRQSNFLSMEDHCRYMFIAHVEGKLHHPQYPPPLPHLPTSSVKPAPNSPQAAPTPPPSNTDKPAAA
ncbi:MAG: glycosyl transferase family 90 [Janthinobacterium lividum]